jgi:hypothetical protein
MSNLRLYKIWSHILQNVVQRDGDELPPGVLPQSKISAAIERAIKQVAAMPKSYQNILQHSASPTNSPKIISAIEKDSK